jgi:hypothetical protein
VSRVLLLLVLCVVFALGVLAVSDLSPARAQSGVDVWLTPAPPVCSDGVHLVLTPVSATCGDVCLSGWPDGSGCVRVCLGLSASTVYLGGKSP